MERAIVVGLDMRKASDLAKMGGFLCGRSDALIEHKPQNADFEIAFLQQKIQQAKSSEERLFWFGYKIGWESVCRSDRSAI